MRSLSLILVHPKNEIMVTRPFGYTGDVIRLGQGARQFPPRLAALKRGNEGVQNAAV